MSNGTTTTEKSEIEKKLDDLQKQMEKTQDDVEKKNIILDSLKAGMTELAKTDGEVKQIKDAYEKAYDIFYKEIDELTCYFNQKKTVVGQRPENEKKDVEQTIQKFNEIRKPRKTSFDTNNENYTEAKEAFENCKNIQEIAKKQNDFDSLKKYQKEIEDKLKNLKSLKNIVEKEQQKGKLENVCFWIEEFESEKFVLKGKDTFSQELMTSWSKLDKAKSECRNKERDMKIAKIDLDTAQNKLNELDSPIKGRSEDILSKISEIIKNNPPEKPHNSGKKY